MQTILGSGGAIGISLAQALPQYTKKIRLVSRNPEKLNNTDELVSADLTHPGSVLDAVKGSDVVYLVVGLKYDNKTWEEQWPVIMQNVIEACKTHSSKLVFLDNVYMYGKEGMDHMTEETPFKPCSKKGRIRANIAQMILDEVEQGELTALIARAADFLGPTNSVPVEVGYKNMLKGKKPLWFISDQKIHNLTFTPQAGEAVALLGNTPDAYNQTWHLPSTKEKMTGRDWYALFAEEMGIKLKIQVVPKWMLQIMGLFNPLIKTTIEMLYQNEEDYYFDSSKFEKAFKIEPLSARESVRWIIENVK